MLKDADIFPRFVRAASGKRRMRTGFRLFAMKCVGVCCEIAVLGHVFWGIQNILCRVYLWLKKMGVTAAAAEVLILRMRYNPRHDSP